MTFWSNDVTRASLHRVVKNLGGQCEVARILNVPRSQISRWLSGGKPDPKNKAKLEELEFVLARLSQTFNPSTARKWLAGMNARLGNRRPLDLIAQNRIAEVIAAIEQDDPGSYA